jgi:type IV fimbrial biogenesis protein FimT
VHLSYPSSALIAYTGVMASSFARIGRRAGADPKQGGILRWFFSNPVPALRRRPSGFTLIELMVALAVTAIVLGIGVPSFQNVMERNRAASQTNEMLGALQATRSEAIRRNATHRFCSSSTGWVIRTPASSTAIREGTLQQGTTVTAYCADFRADGLPYACDCATSTVGSTLITNGQVTVTTGSQTRSIRIRTGSIHVE